MKLLIQSAATAGLLMLAACGGNTPAENAAENIRDTADNQADYLEEQGQNMAENILGATENQAEAVRDAGEARADAMENIATPSSVNGM
ncbi:MAG: hypothetical protein ACT4N8_00060 [Sphingosinicella sp.]|uniref:hypothetical protein n=1 Tax=Sphingosinicella sp. TaxID=1917971 RepID=UPI004037893D